MLRRSSPSCMLLTWASLIVAPLLGLVVDAARCAAQAVNSDDLRRRQETQLRAAELARELVRNLLDVQMQQLDENGLTDRPLYKDVKTMRENIDGLVEAEMSEVVGLLLKAQSDPAERRDESFLAARQKIGEVLASLLAERQSLSRRLRTAEIAAQVRRLIDVETIVRDDTMALPMQNREQRETQQLSTLADQRDARKLYDKLVETLGEARTWGSEIGRTAVDGLALLKASETGEHISRASVGLETGDFAAAAEHEAAAIRGLQVLLKKVKETQGLIEADRKAALEVVREMIRRQDELIDATKQTPAADPLTQDLLKRQTQLGRDLVKLADLVLDKPQAAPLVERAREAGDAATVELFNERPDLATKAQATVRANLAAVEKQLQEETETHLPDDRNAEQLAARTVDLEKVRDALKLARAELSPHVKPVAAADPNTPTETKPAAETKPTPTPTSTNPTTPTDPKAAADPKAATDPTIKPADAAKAGDPTKPADPLKPSDPTKPGDPAKPNDPTKPGDMPPAAATKPYEPGKPADPTKPTDGAKPADPTKPAEPTKPGDAPKSGDTPKPADMPEPAAPMTTPAAPTAVATALPDAPKLNPAVTKAALDKTAKDVARAGHERDLPAVVQAKIRESARTARDAAKAQDDPMLGDAGKQQQVNQTDASLERALSEVEAALADAKRMTPAVAAGELSRAAEALDRAAAAERDVAARAVEEAKKPTPDAEAVAQLKDDHMLAGAVADDVEAAVAAMAPEAKTPLAEAKAAATEASKQLQPTEPGKSPTAQQLRQAATQANTSAQKLAAAAAQLRRQAMAQATNLAREADRQAAAIKPTAQAVDQAAMNAGAAATDARSQLAAAEQAVERAEAEQMRAAGRAEAADLQELAGKITQAADMQQAAETAAEDHAAGRSENPLDAVTMQQQTADEAEKLAAAAAARPAAKAAEAERRVDPLVEQLRRAQQAAQTAAKQTLEGKKAEAAEARREAAQALDEAAATAKAEQTEAMKKPAGPVDAAAQQRATAAVAEAKKSALAHAPLSTPALEMAEKESMNAEQAALAGKPEDTAKAQTAAEKNLAAAKKALEQAQAQLAAREKQQMQQQAAATQKLGDQAAPLDPEALQALREAQNAAAQAAAAPERRPAAAAADQKQTQQAMQRAAAELAAREEMVKRDQQLAQALLASLNQQQAAASEINAGRAALAQAMTAPPNPQQPAANPAAQTPPPAATAEAAARKLEQAMDNFSQAAQVTGQAAQEVSGQNTIANPALAMALDKASALPVPTPDGAAPQQPPTAAAPAPAGDPQTGAAPPPMTQPGQAPDQPLPQMGKGMTPSSPEATAQMMAGPQALRQMAQLQQSSAPPKPGSAPGQMPNIAAAPNATAGQPGPSDQASNKPQELQNSPSQNPRDSSQPFVGNAARNAADVALAGNGEHREQPWVAKLPAELRQAIRAEAQRPAPRGYEERLRNYFKNID